MKISILGDFSGFQDEGYKNVAYYTARELERTQEIHRVNIKRKYHPDFWSTIFNSNADVVHLFSQPTVASLIFAHFCRTFSRVPTVVSALRPEILFDRLGNVRNFTLYLLKPDLMFVQSQLAKTRFESLGYKTAFLPNGVDINKFHPIDRDKKYALRNKYGFKNNAPVVLHVGHIIPSRNLCPLVDLSRIGIEVIVVGSTYQGVDNTIIEKLERGGINIIKGFIPEINEFYQLSDCYIFPAVPGTSLSMPLSILEAMACNLPVVTTKFDGITDFIPEDRGVRIVEDSDSFMSGIIELLNNNQIETRKLVERYSWLNIANKLIKHYRELLTK